MNRRFLSPQEIDQLDAWVAALRLLGADVTTNYDLTAAVPTGTARLVTARRRCESDRRGLDVVALNDRSEPATLLLVVNDAAPTRWNQEVLAVYSFEEAVEAFV